MTIAALLAAFAGRRQFIGWRPVPRANQKIDKVPHDPRTQRDIDAQDPREWVTAEEAASWAAAGVPVGIVLYEGSGLFCIDLDHAAQPDGTWSPLAVSLCQRFAGAALEVSQSGTGLHIIGSLSAPIPDHRTRRDGLPLEIYDRRRFIALTGSGFTGDPRTDHTGALAATIAEYLPDAVVDRTRAEWTTGPFEGWRGGGTDAQIIQSLRNQQHARAVFGGGASFSDLYDANANALARSFPDPTGRNPWNGSAADQALANHLAYATGYDCDRTLRLMMTSPLRREKWDRDDYMQRTILMAVAGKIPERVPVAPHEATMPATAATEPAGPAPVPPPPADKIEASTPNTTTGARHSLAPGDYVLSTAQPELFKGCVYISDCNGILMPSGSIHSAAQFNVDFGGLTFQMRVDGTGQTDAAYDVFVKSQIVAFPRADALTFDPRQDSRAVIIRDNIRHINSWVPVDVPMIDGDPAPFVNHIRKLFPLGTDAEILLAYFAAIVQYKGTKFQWAPLLQGVEGNGKTFLSKALAQCVGLHYTHHAKASQLDSRFNIAFYGKLLVTVEDVFISEAKASMWETLKPMITDTRMEIEGKGVDKVDRDVCFNFIMNSNHRNAIRKTPNDRRLAIFFGAQQHAVDLTRDGLTLAYFKKLYNWADNGGYAIIAHHLTNYKIPDELNPATHCVRAPKTSSTEAAIRAGRGAIEQEAQEAIDEGRTGFRKGWINSMAFDNLLSELGRSRQVPRDKRQELIMSLGYVPHPALPDGRVGAPLPDGTRPRLYIREEGHPSEVPGVDIAASYMADQQVK